ncbi:MAG: lysylphosphatidylglycerol synthase transmembrane domain-containing protein [Candidatus Limnocylindrales bacterium]
MVSLRRLARRAVGGARWLVGLAVVGFLLLRFDPSSVVRLFGAADLRLVFVGTAGLVAMHTVAAATWRALAQRLGGQRLSWATALRAYYAAQALGSLTPGNVGSDAYRLVAPTDDVSWRGRFFPIAVQRITSSIALAALGIASLALLPEPGWSALAVSGGAVILAAGSALLLALLFRRSGIRARGYRSSLPGGTPVATARARTRVAPAALLGLILGLAFHAGSIAMAYLLVAAVTPVAAPLQVLACLTIARLSILVPLSPSGLGVQEGALALLFLQIGLPPQVALTASLLGRIALLATATIGGILLAMDPWGKGTRVHSIRRAMTAEPAGPRIGMMKRWLPEALGGSRGSDQS